MVIRFAFPVLLTLAGILLFILPIASVPDLVETKTSDENYTGNNTFSCSPDHPIFTETTIHNAEIVQQENLFHLTLWIGGHDNRITFVLKNEVIKETAYELNHPSKSYVSFLYHGNECTYSADVLHTGMLMIHKYDSINHIIAGSFEFMAYSTDCDELVSINQGMFDATYIPK